MNGEPARLHRLLEQARGRYQAGHGPQAERLFRAVLAESPRHAEALHHLGLLALRDDRIAEGLGHFKAALEAEPGNGARWLALADALYRSGRCFEARQVLEQGWSQGLGGAAAAQVRARIEDAVALFAQAVGEHRAGRTAEAEAALHGLLATVPCHVDALTLMAVLLQETGREAEAVPGFRRVIGLQPDHAEARRRLGQALYRAGLPDEAAGQVREAMALEPGRAADHNNLAIALQAAGRLDEAAAHYRHALALQPGLVAARINLHSLLYDAGDLEPAAACLEAGLAEAPDDAACHFFLGVIRDRQGRAGEAGRHFAALPAASPQARGGLDSWRYLRALPGPPPRLFGTTAEGLAIGLAAARPDGLVLEFGVRFGTSIRQIAARVAGPVHGFDTFQGLPETWHGQPGGLYSTGGRLPRVPANVRLHPGLFEDTLPPFLERHPGPLAFANIDCDLYSSTRTVLDALAGRLVPGSVLVFDEYLVNENWRLDEFRAFQEAVERHGWCYDYLAVSLFSKQAVVILRAPDQRP